ncbi:MAG: uroporphyrinogen-III C-methyltransferase [Gammaproteobacteria bacterium]
MNDLPTLPEPTPPPASSQPEPAVAPAVAASAPAAAPAPTVVDMLQRPLTVAVIVLFILLAAHAFSTRNHMQTLRMEMAKSLQRGELITTETSTLAKTVQDQVKDLQAKVSLLENRQAEAQSQQLALEQLYQDLSKNRDEWALAEIEQVLSTASQQLQLAGNVQGALIALQNADRSLSRSDKPQFITIRRAIARDTEKLKALPTLDLAGVALRLDNVIAQVDTLPMLADEKPAVPVQPGRVGVAVEGKPEVPKVPDSLWARTQQTWRNWSAEMWSDIRQLIRVRSVDNPAALMMSPTQSYFLRENLKLRLLNARLALLSRNEEAFRTDLVAAQDALTRYFDVKARETQTAQALLRQVQANNLAIEMPSLAESLDAVRNYKAKP